MYLYMRVTLNLDEKKYRQAAEMTGVKEKTRLIQMGLDNLIREVALERLASS
ncbi:MAG TPA: DUF2191 domain-containing protein, partial [Deltaproteobacteria bacterium]|nr:DUF2191 domain-containing protein [Deltaproteobacteria bacterium]